MKSTLLLTALLLGLPSGVVLADEDEFYKTKNCFACHRVDRNTLGPGFKNVAAKYADDKSAEALLAKKIREGGGGVWGEVAMPAQPQVSEEESVRLAKWILQLK